MSAEVPTKEAFDALKKEVEELRVRVEEAHKALGDIAEYHKKVEERLSKLEAKPKEE